MEKSVIIMETDPVKIKKLAEEKEEENVKFRLFLKQIDMEPEEVDAIVHRLYREVAAAIDCKACKNCCKELLPVLDQDDVERLSRGLEVSVEDFKNQYLITDDENPECYTFRKPPCPMLESDICASDEYRPKVCTSYPHLHKDGFVFRTITAVNNCFVCPIVFNVYERLKDELWHYRGDDCDCDDPDYFDDLDDLEDYDDLDDGDLNIFDILDIFNSLDMDFEENA